MLHTPLPSIQHSYRNAFLSSCLAIKYQRIQWWCLYEAKPIEKDWNCMNLLLPNNNFTLTLLHPASQTLDFLGGCLMVICILSPFNYINRQTHNNNIICSIHANFTKEFFYACTLTLSTSSTKAVFPLQSTWFLISNTQSITWSTCSCERQM